MREELKDVPEEVAFYDEAVREELFHTATQIRCGKKQRRMYQKLVTDGVASVEGIRRAWIYIYENNSRVEIKFLCIEKIMAGFLILFTLFGILAIYASLVNIESLFDLSKYPNTLFIFSSGILFISSSLHQLLPALFARAIRKRLKEKEEEEEDALSSSSPTDELSSSAQET